VARHLVRAGTVLAAYNQLCILDYAAVVAAGILSAQADCVYCPAPWFYCNGLEVFVCFNKAPMVIYVYHIMVHGVLLWQQAFYDNV